MGTFTALDADQLGALASAFELGDVASSRVIAAGTINSNFAIVTASGTYFLRVNEGKSEEDVAWEAQLVSALADRGVTTPKPLVARDRRPYAASPPSHFDAAGRPSRDLSGAGTTKWVSAFAWRAGAHLEAPLPPSTTDAHGMISAATRDVHGTVTAAHAGAFGTALAELHVAALALPDDWRRRSIYDHDHLVARFATIERVDDPALAHARTVLREELAIAEQAADIRRAATHGIIHGDLFRDNVLWDGDRISAILDFEQASGGSLAYDLAVCINDWCWAEPRAASTGAGGADNGAGTAGDGRTAASWGEVRLDLAGALLAGYRRVRDLTAADREALPYELRASAARFTITRITDVYLARVTNPAKDFRAFLARCEAWRSLSLQALTQLF